MISVTESAIKQFDRLLKKNNSKLGIRLSIKKTGCSGLTYALDYVDTIDPHDIKVQVDNITILIDSNSAIYLTGTIINYVKNGLNENFEFSNPNEKNRCGCGISFTV
jgi:iron-sulfur cluster assembly protein